MDTQNIVTAKKKKSKQLHTLAQAEEQHLASLSSSSTITTSSVTTNKKVTALKGVAKMSKTKSEDHITNVDNSSKINVTKSTTASKKEFVKTESINDLQQVQERQIEEELLEEVKQNGDHVDDSLKKNNASKRKPKLRKNKKGEAEKQNISVKSSFSKFDALQKRNLIHNTQGEVQINCRLCNKPVYKMEEVKAERNIYHKNCFRCQECNKQLKMDNYQSHEGVLYCIVHFKLLFAPKCVEDDEMIQPQKPELIIRENQPTELPPDVVRASDKPDLGLEELQQLNVRLRFQVFEQGNTTANEKLQQQELNNNNVVRRSASILSKVAKLQQLGSSVMSQDSSTSSDNDDENNEDNFDCLSDNPNADLLRQNKRERPVGIGEAMNDIRTLFEKGHGATKEERREERKQEIQNIRSRLFLGKQARIKEMYQQAVAESGHAITAADKKQDIDIEVDSKSLRDRFEKGEVFTENKSTNEYVNEGSKKTAIEKEADVFESAITKKSRSIFMELDANVVTGKNQNIVPSQSNSRIFQQQKSIKSESGEFDNDNVVKCGEVVEDVKIETSEISEKFKFFETYHPYENKKREFRITPPREGVVKMPSLDENSNEEENTKAVSPDRNIIAHSRTTSMMLNKFRELEKNPNRNVNESPKQLKCFTPPPDGNHRLYVEEDSDEYGSNEDDDEDDNDAEEDEDEDSEIDNYNNFSHLAKDDESLREAQNAARAKQLRIKFEKWQANEIKRNNNDSLNQIFADNVADETSIESTKSIRERFEKMKNDEKTAQPMRPRHQVNRFV